MLLSGIPSPYHSDTQNTIPYLEPIYSSSLEESTTPNVMILHRPIIVSLEVPNSKPSILP